VGTSLAQFFLVFQEIFPVYSLPPISAILGLTPYVLPIILLPRGFRATKGAGLKSGNQKQAVVKLGYRRPSGGDIHAC